jgi:hypothetical protein
MGGYRALCGSPGQEVLKAKRFKEDIMKFLRPTRAWLVCTLLLALSPFTLATTAFSGRPFSGYFDLSGVTEQGDLVQVTLHLKLLNQGDADVKSVIVTLVDSAPFMTLRGNFQPVKVWKSHQYIEMSQEFTVSKLEFSHWMHAPGQPNLVILFQDAKGKTWQKGAQISRWPLVRVAQ